MSHIIEIRNSMREAGADACIICSEANEYYAVGFRGEGTVVVFNDEAVYITDSRYIEDAVQKIHDCRVVLSDREHPAKKIVRGLVSGHSVKKLALEDETLAYNRYCELSGYFTCPIISADRIIKNLRASKDDNEIEAMRNAQEITDQAFTEILNIIQPGISENEIAARLVYEMLSRGANKVSFDPVVVSGVNGSKPHGIPGDKKIQSGEFITMDFGCVFHGYCSDMTRTVAVGSVTEEMRSVYQTVLLAQKAGINMAKAGVSGRDIDKAARDVIENAGYGQYFGHSFGHSLGIEIHEEPNSSPLNDNPMPIHCVCSAEPGIYIPGKFGVRIEDVIVLNEDGCTDITKSQKELIIL